MKPRVEPLWSRVAEVIAEAMGLHFPPHRLDCLRRGLLAAAPDFGFKDAEECAKWLVSAQLKKVDLEILAGHLTVGETYFFRETKLFDLVERHILPEFIRKRSGRQQRLRLWSAGCCTGEEPYSLAIMLSQIIPNPEDWHVSILATDINERFLRKAAAGIYGEWSFRGTPTALKDRYFQRTPDGRYAILPEIRQRVTFAQLNLVEDVFPALATDTNAMDVIFCRNVLMYFTIPQARKVIGNLRRAMVDDGWLAVSPSEASQVLFAGFRTENFPGVILYRKGAAQDRAKETWSPPPVEPQEFVASTAETPALWLPPESSAPAADEPVENTAPQMQAAAAARLYEEGRYAEVSELLLSSTPAAPGEYSLLARALANQGQLSDALAWCDRWLAADKLDSSGHYLRAIVLQELGESEAAHGALQRAIYLRPDLVLAHFALGNLARAASRIEEANRHFTNALHLLRDAPADELLPESDGLTAGRLTEIIHSLLAIETVP